jgi:pimeloyl-ACP methyl ester carboxylesterase
LPNATKKSPLKEKYAEMFASIPLEHFDKRLEFVTSVPNLAKRLHEIKVPILGIDGEDDPFPAHPELAAHMPNFEEKIIPNTGRFVHWENPEAFNANVHAFLQRLKY